MHSTSILNIISASALFALTQAAPLVQEARSALVARGIYSKCKLPSGLYWDGTCSVDPCGQWIGWCPDYEYGTWNPIKTDTPKPIEQSSEDPNKTPAQTGGAYYVCAANGFRGTCSYDPCSGKWDSWCKDYDYKTYTPVTKPAVATKRGLIYSKCKLPSGLQWDGYCSQDPCGMWQKWCVDYDFGTWNPKSTIPSTSTEGKGSDPTPAPTPQTCSVTAETHFEPGVLNTCKYGSGLNFYTCETNGFNGCCSEDPCGKAWCKDYKPECYNA